MIIGVRGSSGMWKACALYSWKTQEGREREREREREEGKKEGREGGRKEGKEEGKEEGREEGRREGISKPWTNQFTDQHYGSECPYFLIKHGTTVPGSIRLSHVEQTPWCLGPVPPVHRRGSERWRGVCNKAQDLGVGIDTSLPEGDDGNSGMDLARVHPGR